MKSRVSQRRLPGGGETGKEKRGMCGRFGEDYIRGWQVASEARKLRGLCQ